jgi:hypothetical protein
MNFENESVNLGFERNAVTVEMGGAMPPTFRHMKFSKSLAQLVRLLYKYNNCIVERNETFSV